jgi:hypothetical protein
VSLTGFDPIQFARNPLNMITVPSITRENLAFHSFWLCDHNLDSFQSDFIKRQ